MYWNINHRPGLDGSVGWIGPVSHQLIITIVAVKTICTVKTKPLSKSKSWQLNLRGLTDFFFFFLGWRKWFTAVKVGGKIWRKDSSRCGTGPFLRAFIPQLWSTCDCWLMWRIQTPTTARSPHLHRGLRGLDGDVVLTVVTASVCARVWT